MRTSKMIKLIKQIQMNPHFDPKRADNGGGYDQRLSTYEVEGGYKLEISDENIGDFGDAYTVSLWKGNNLIATFHLNDRQGDCNRGMESTFSNSDPLQKEIMEFCQKSHFPITPIEEGIWDYVKNGSARVEF